MLIPTEAIATVSAISSSPAISSAPASSSASAGLSTRKTPSLRESPDPDSGNHPARFPLAFPWLFPNVRSHVYPERAGIPKLEGCCHSSLGSSGDISIPHSGVSRGHRNVPHASVSHYTTSLDSSGLRRPPSRTLLHHNGSFQQDPLLARKG